LTCEAAHDWRTPSAASASESPEAALIDGVPLGIADAIRAPTMLEAWRLQQSEGVAVLSSSSGSPRGECDARTGLGRVLRAGRTHPVAATLARSPIGHLSSGPRDAGLPHRAGSASPRPPPSAPWCAVGRRAHRPRARRDRRHHDALPYVSWG